jgi:molybdopterin-binding protein
MNKILATIEEIKSKDSISIIKLKSDLGIFYTAILESPDSFTTLKKGKKVFFLFKETDAFLHKEKLLKINTIKGKIKNIQEGELFIRLILQAKDYEISMLFTKIELDMLKINLNDAIYIFVKPTQIMLEY